MGTAADGGVNGHVFPPEPEDGWCEPEQPSRLEELGFIILLVLVVLGCIVVGIRIVLGFLDGVTP